jgi:hypothetical protein
VAARKKRLPVIQSSPDAEPSEPRPPWHWVGFGALAIFVVWLPLTFVAERVARSLSAPIAAGPQVVALALAALAGAYVVGRWGSGAREARLAGTATGVIASLIAMLGGGPLSWLLAAAVAVTAIATLFAWIGGRLGAKRKVG